MERRLRWSILLLAAATVVQGRVKQMDITGLVGKSIKLPCEIDEEKCGEVHNIQWYRGDGDTRVFIYSELANVDTSENMLQGRGYFEYTKGSSLTELEIRELKASDESLYKCELTYLEVRDNCAVIQFVNLTTIAKPTSVRILLEDGTEARAGSVIGPFEEESELYLKCESAGGKPAASVSWYNGTVQMAGDTGAIMSEDGTGTGMNELRVELSRHDLGSVFECRAQNEAVEYPLSAKVTLDLHVRPRTIELAGLEKPVMAGSQVTLTCKVTGARPAANITWLRGGDTLQEQTSDSESIQPDTTTETISRYTFTATPEDNGDHIVCVATNAVIERKNESPLRAPVKVEVLYAPAEVNVQPSNITVNESMDILLFCEYKANPTNLSSVIWYKNGRRLDIEDGDKFDGGIPENPHLLIKNTSRHDVGRYRCEVANDVGVGAADNEATVHVQFPPDTFLAMEPGVVNEEDKQNVTFYCNISDGNPNELLAVRWYLNGDLLREVPDVNCTNTTSDIYGDLSSQPYDIQFPYDSDSNEVVQLEDLCDTDPGQLVLMDVARSFMANYSCAGKNSAGWGPRSDEKEFLVHYPPNQTVLKYEPAKVMKGSSVTLTCEVDDPGYPPADKYIWMRGNHLISDITSNQWRINTVKLEDATTFSCTVGNEAGSTPEGKVNLTVFTKPQFIERLPLYLGALMNSSSISVTCRVECSPLCSLQWFKDDEIIDENNPLYSIKTSILDPDPRTNDLESVLSTLSWNMSAWPGQMLDRVKDNANYTCRSTANAVGPGVSSTTFFTVEYPPENISLSSPIVDVVEGQTPSEVSCKASAYPEATYIWKKDGAALQTGDRLRLNYQGGIKREKAGEYECQAQNKHGVTSTAVFVNVMYPPTCNIRQTEEDGEYLLLCEVDAVPDDVTFTWRVDNQTVIEGIRTEGRVSTLTVLPGTRDFGTYYCHVNNSVGPVNFCTIDVAGVSGWGMHLGNINFIIVIAVVAVALVLMLIICIIVILWCRRKKTKDKYGVPNPLEERENPDGTSASPGGTGVQPLHKWPIRPGVHVHVTNVQSLSKLSDQPADTAAPPPTQEKVVTFRRVETDSDSKEDNLDTVGDANQSKASPNGAGGPDDRAVYENLPFHGMQQPPSKPGDGSPAGTARGDGTSRPPSELSQNGSSGYGSTFSQGNPQYGSMRSQRSFQYGSTRSQRGDSGGNQQHQHQHQQLLPIPQSPDLPEAPVTHDKTTQSETNNNEEGADRPVPPQRGPAAKPPYHNLSLPYRGHRARQRQAQGPPAAWSGQPPQQQPEPEPQGDSFEMWEQSPSHPLANRGFYNCNQPPQQQQQQQQQQQRVPTAEPWAPPHQRPSSHLNPAHRPRPHGSRPNVQGQHGPGGPHGGPGSQGPHGGHAGPHGGPGGHHGGPHGAHGAPVPSPLAAGVGGAGPRGPMTYNVKNGTVYADLEYRDVCGAPSRVQKDYVPTEYAVLQFSGASHEIDV